MDDRDLEMLGGSTLGGVVGGAAGGPPGAVAGAAVGGWLFRRENDHNETLRRAYYESKRATSEDANLHADHVDPRGAERARPRSVDGVAGSPDLVVIDPPSTHFVVEVATPESFEEDPERVLEQLDAIRSEGFERVLVVPDGTLSTVGEWAKEHSDAGTLEGSLTVATPEGFADEL